MFLKLVVLILSVGLVAGLLLANRQQKVEAAKQLAEAQQRLSKHDETLWRLRTEIAQRVTPQRVQQMAAGVQKTLGPLLPLRSERYEQLVQRELEALEDRRLSLALGDGVSASERQEASRGSMSRGSSGR